MPDRIHVTCIQSHSVYGHPTSRCDAAGCATQAEWYYEQVYATDVEVGHCYDIDDDGLSAEVED